MPLFPSSFAGKLWLKSMCLRWLLQTVENGDKHNLSRLYNDLFQICKKFPEKISVNLHVGKYRLVLSIAAAWRARPVLLANTVFGSLCAMLGLNHASTEYRAITLETLRNATVEGLARN
jgi:hypothetical protein